MKPWVDDGDLRLYHGEAREVLRCLPSDSVDCVITSPPYYGLRDYGSDEQIGLEKTPGLFVANLVDVFEEVRRVLAGHGTAWVNLGDTYGTGQPGTKLKDLLGVPWRVAFGLQEAGWWLRSDVIWHKVNATPESVKDRPTKTHEYLFMLTKQPTYFFNQDAVKEPHESVRWGGRYHKPNGREKYRDLDERIAGTSMVRPDRESWDHYPEGGKNVRTVWRIPTKPYEGAHFATFPEELVRRCVLAGCPSRVCRVCGEPGGGWPDCGHGDWRPGLVLDPFVGSGTTCKVARDHERHSIGIDLNEEYLALAATRLQQQSLFT